MVIPYERGDLVNRVHLEGEITQLDHIEQGTRIQGLVDEELAVELTAVAVVVDTNLSTP